MRDDTVTTNRPAVDHPAVAPPPVPPAVPPGASEILADEAARVAAADADLAAARDQLNAATRAVQYHLARSWAIRSAVAPIIAGLIVGSVVAFVISMVLIFVFGVELPMVIATIFASYVALGGGAFWFFGGLDGASRDTHTQTRGEWLEQAVQRCKLAAGELESAKALADRAREHWQMLVDSANSEANHRQAETSRLLAIDPGRLYPDEFERFVAEVFRHLGFTCDVIGQSGDQGVDVIASKGTTRLAIQAKRYIGGVGNTAVQQVYAGMAHHRCQRCLVVTTGEFTSAAITLAQSTGCILIGTDRISELIRGEITF